MRKLVAGFAISVDGYIEDLNGEYDWITIDPEIDFAEYMKRFDTYLLGRISYEKALLMGSAAFGNDPVYVFSQTLDKVDAPFILIKQDVPSFIQELKAKDGKDIALFGGAGLLTSMLEMKVVDEISLSVIPVLLGAGKPFVGSLSRKFHLSFKGSKTYNNGTINITWDVINA